MLINIRNVIVMCLKYDLQKEYILSIFIVNVVLENNLLNRLLEFVDHKNDITGRVILNLTTFYHFNPYRGVSVLFISLAVDIGIHVEEITWVKDSREGTLSGWDINLPNPAFH